MIEVTIRIALRIPQKGSRKDTMSMRWVWTPPRKIALYRKNEVPFDLNDQHEIQQYLRDNFLYIVQKLERRYDAPVVLQVVERVNARKKQNMPAHTVIYYPADEITGEPLYPSNGRISVRNWLEGGEVKENPNRKDR